MIYFIFSGTYCDPLEDKNVHAFLQNVTGTLKQDDIIMAATKVVYATLIWFNKSGILKNLRIPFLVWLASLENLIVTVII